MLSFQPRPRAAKHTDRESLWPAVLHKSKADQEREGLVVRKPDLNASSRRIHAVECEIRALRIDGALAAAEIPIGLEEALQSGSRFRTGLCRTFENAGDGLLDLIALEHIESFSLVSVQAVNLSDREQRSLASRLDLDQCPRGGSAVH